MREIESSRIHELFGAADTEAGLGFLGAASALDIAVGNIASLGSRSCVFALGKVSCGLNLTHCNDLGGENVKLLERILESNRFQKKIVEVCRIGVGF